MSRLRPYLGGGPRGLPLGVLALATLGALTAALLALVVVALAASTIAGLL